MVYRSLPRSTSNPTDAEWEDIKLLLPPKKLVGKQREVNLRDVLDAIFYRR